MKAARGAPRQAVAARRLEREEDMQSETHHRTIEPNLELHRVNGKWFAVRFGFDRKAGLTDTVFDVPKRKHVWRGMRYAKSMRPLTRGECEAYALPRGDEEQRTDDDQG